MANKAAIPQPSIALVGFMAAGKSTIGRLLADRLSWPFIDTDEELESQFGMPIAQLFADDGEAEFRNAERALISRLVVSGNQVIAFGGGAFVDEDTRERTNSCATTVWLDPPFDLVRTRLEESDHRPLARGNSERELRNLWDARRTAYCEARLHIRTSDEDPLLVVERIFSRLREAGLA